MAREFKQPFHVIEGVNHMLVTAWERGARHVVLRKLGDRIEMKFLETDGREHTEFLAFSFEDSLRRLRQLNSNCGRVQVNMGGETWLLDIITPDSPNPDRVFLHMRRDGD